MAKLTGSKRRKLTKRQFAAPKGKGPNRGKNQYPVDTRRRAANAKARATQAYKKGRMSKSMRDRIHARANAVLRRKAGSTTTSTKGGRSMAKRTPPRTATGKFRKRATAKRTGATRRAGTARRRSATRRTTSTARRSVAGRKVRR
jgi:hypothetical protein